MSAVRSSTPNPPWQERITGRWALSWQTIVLGTALTYPQIVLTGGTLGSREVLPEQLPTMALVTAGAVVVAVSFAVIVDFTLFRHRRVHPVPLWLYFTFYMLAGFIYAAGMEVADDVLGVESIIPVWVRFLFAGITTVVFGMAMSLVLEAGDRFRRERARLLEQEVAAEAESLRERGLVDDLRESMEQEVDDVLDEARVRILAASRPTVDAHMVADEVGAAARESVRPLSHALWEQAAAANPRPRIGGVIRRFVAAPRFLPLATAIFIGIGLPGAAIRAVGAAWAPLLILVVVAIMYAVLWFADRMMVRQPRTRHLWFVAGYLATVVIVLLLALLPGQSAAPINDAVAIVIGVTAGVLLVSFVGALEDVREQAIASLQSTVARAHIRQEAERREVAVTLSSLAQHLHGSVQTRLTMCAAGLDRAVSEGDSAAYEACLEQALCALTGHAPKEVWTGDPQRDLQRLASLWAGVCDVTYDVAPGLGTRPNPRIAVAAAAIAEEAVVNAYRHGRAQHVHVSLIEAPAALRVQVVDDGIGVAADASSGLGMATISRLSGGQVTLESAAPDASGARLTVVLAP